MTNARSMHRPIALGLAGTLLAGVGAAPSPAALAKASGPAAHVSTALTVTAVHVAALQPQIALVTGQVRSASQDPTFFSTRDGGRTWTQVQWHGESTPNPYEAYSYDWPVLASDGTLYMGEHYLSSPDASYDDIYASTDGGAHWQDATPGQATGGDSYKLVALSPLLAGVRYVYYQTPGGATLLRSTVGSADYQTITDPSTLAPSSAYARLRTLLPDAALAHVLYAVVDAGSAEPSFVARSTDDGASWRLVPLPAGLTPATTPIGVDPHLPGQLIVRPSHAADRLYTSADGGATWHVRRCPGDLDGACPKAVVDNAFGGGRSYGLYADGLHGFNGGGSAGPRLAITDLLPLPPHAIATIAAGSHAGAPIFVVGTADPAASAAIYSSSDGGQHWTRAVAGTLPPAAAPDRAVQALYVAQARHSVAPAFVALYRTLGLDLLGYPLDEAYRSGDALVQDFQRMEVVLPAGSRTTPLIGPLGVAGCARRCPEAVMRTLPPQPSTASSVYVAATHHSVRGPFLAFWRTHQHVLGAPISEQYQSTNGDGSGRRYLMQYFTNARLEWHPEYHNPRYAVQLGLLGSETLADWGWLPARR